MVNSCFHMLRRLSFLLLLSIFFTNCNLKNGQVQWDNAAIDTNISNDSVYRQLDKEIEIFSAKEKIESSMKRTSDVKYLTGKKINLGEYSNSKYNNCRAYFHSETLSINVGIGNGFGGQGFIINYKDNKFYTEPYFSTDVIYPGEIEPSYKIIYQKLKLGKVRYSLGDSLYGHIDFKSIEIDKENNKTEHFGKGYFRAKVTEL